MNGKTRTMQQERAIPEGVNQEAADWFARLDSGEMTANETERFQHWRADHPAHAATFAKVEAAWAAMDEHVLTPAPPARSAPSRRRIRREPHSSRSRMRRWAGSAIAASLLGIVTFATDLPMRFRSDVLTATGEVRSITLPDGSIATLDTATAIAFDARGRNVRLLRGQAAFRIAPHAGQPFSVTSGDVVTTALGTRFIVRHLEDETDVAVTEHRVRVASDRQSVIVHEGEAVRHVPNAIGTPHRIMAADADAWTRGRIRVVNRPLGEVVAELSRYHAGYIQLLGDDIARQPVSGTFDIGDPVGAIDMIRNTLGLRTTRITDRVIFIHR